MTKINNNKQKKQKKNVPTNRYDLKCYSAQELYDFAIKAYQRIDQSGGDKWNKMMTESGTKKDKVSAAGLMILEHPENSLRYFDMLVKWCFDDNKNFAIKSCEALTNVYVQHVFVEKNTLKSFFQSIQEYIHTHKKNTEVDTSQLIGFYLESEIKQYYSQLIKALQIVLGCDLTHIKKVALKSLGSLAKYRQLRRTILSLIINKLGDTDLQVVNEVTKCLKQQFYEDIQSGETLLEEVQRFLFREKCPQKSQFYVINFLNCINLKFLNEKSMNRIFQIFYHFFKKFVDTNQQASSDDLSSRLFLNSIKGLNRIFSSMKSGSNETKKNIQEKLDDVYKVIHKTTNLKAKIQLLLFLFQTHIHLHQNLIDRYYRTLYDFLSQNKIVHCSLAEMFFDLVLVSIKQDENVSRMMAMCKRLLQLCFHAHSNFIITTLLMLDKIIQSNDGFQTLLFQAENLMGQEGSIEKYDIFKREPKFANAQKTCLWQLHAFANHYHPTIRKFIETIFSRNPIEFQGANPLLQFSVTSFIEKFSLKKQKKSDSWKMKVRRNLKKIRTSKYESLLAKPLENFNEDEQFIKKYIQKREQIHVNRNKMQGKDIQEFADEIIYKEMDRLNPQDQDYSDMNQEDFSDEEEMEGDDANEFEEGEGEEFEEDEDFGQDEFQEGENQELEDQENSEMLDEDEQEMDEEKQFQDVFDEIQDQESFPEKSKKIRKPNKNSKPVRNFKNGKSAKFGNKKFNGKKRR